MYEAAKKGYFFSWTVHQEGGGGGKGLSTKLRGGCLKALVDCPLKKRTFLRLPLHGVESNMI